MWRMGGSELKWESVSRDERIWKVADLEKWTCEHQYFA
jgi:hypothetical protein